MKVPTVSSVVRSFISAQAVSAFYTGFVVE